MSGSFTGRETACCFSGHRSLTAAEMERASAEISALLPRLTDAGITRFYAGGALGFDLAASVTILPCVSLSRMTNRCRTDCAGEVLESGVLRLL